MQDIRSGAPADWVAYRFMDDHQRDVNVSFCGQSDGIIFNVLFRALSRDVNLPASMVCLEIVESNTFLRWSSTEIIWQGEQM